jgi:hypothetical protein
MTPELQPLLDLLPAHLLPWFWKLSTFVGGVRLFLKPALVKFQPWLTAKVHAAALSETKDDDELWLRVLSHRAYRFVAFFVFDTLLSIKLPTADSLILHAAKQDDPVPKDIPYTP